MTEKRLHIHRILVPVDYSEESERALRLACEMAAHFGASLELLHVYQIPSDLYPYTLFVTAETKEEIHEREKDRIHAWCDKARAEGVVATGHVVRGENHDKVPDTARDLDVDLIVIGSRGQSSLKHTFFGSTAERTVQLAPCPVITTH